MKRSSYLFLSLLLSASAVSQTAAADPIEQNSKVHANRSTPVKKTKIQEAASTNDEPKSAKGKKSTAKIKEESPAKKKAAPPAKEKAVTEKKAPKELPLVEVSSDEINNAVKFYGDRKARFPEKITQDGHYGVSKNTVTIENINEDPKLKALEGHPLSVIFTNPDGDCCFYAMGRTRTQLVDALKDLIAEKQNAYIDAKEAKKDLSNDLESYEVFLVALQKECSGADEEEKALQKKNQKAKEKGAKKGIKKAEEAPKEGSENPLENWKTTDSKEKLQEIVEALFGEKSNGTWMPAGLLPAVQEKLGLRLVIWHVTREEETVVSKKKTVKEFVSVAQSIGAEPDDMSARHILFLKEKKGKDARAAHFVILAPLDTAKFIPTKKFEPKQK